MKTVLFATRTVPALAPLTDTLPLALLSVACKPLIVYTIEALAMARLTDVIVIASTHSGAIKAALGDGARWGMRFEYVIAGARESDERVLERILRRKLDDEYLLVRGEILRSPIIAEFVKRARLIESRSVVATIARLEAGVRLIRDRATLQQETSNLIDDPQPGKAETRIDFSEAHLSLLDGLLAFYRANLDILSGRFSGLVVPGREVAPGVRVGRHTSPPATAIKEMPVLIGSRCSIADTAELGGEVVISNDVVVDRGAMIRSAVILPNTYVGELVEVTNAIVAGNRLIHVDTGTVTTVADSFLLAGIPTAEIGAQVRDLVDRVTGACLLIASLWLWPIAMIAAMSTNPTKPIRSRLLLGNRKSASRRVEFKAYEFATSILPLRYLPYLLAVVAGDLSLVGVAPLESGSSSAQTEEWERVCDGRKVGVIGPVQLAAYDTPEDQRRAAEADGGKDDVGIRSTAEDMKWILRAVKVLLTPRAWRPKKHSPARAHRTIVMGAMSAPMRDQPEKARLASHREILLSKRKQRTLKVPVITEEARII